MSSKVGNKVVTEKFVLEVVGDLRDAVGVQFDEVNGKLNKMDEKIDRMMEQVVDIAGQFKKFDEERLVLAHRQRNHEDRIEKLEKVVFAS